MVPPRTLRRQAPRSFYQHRGAKYRSLFNMGHYFPASTGEPGARKYRAFEALKTAKVLLSTKSDLGEVTLEHSQRHIVDQ